MAAHCSGFHVVRMAPTSARSELGYCQAQQGSKEHGACLPNSLPRSLRTWRRCMKCPWAVCSPGWRLSRHGQCTGRLTGVSIERPYGLLLAEASRPAGWVARRRLGAAAGLCSNAWAPRTDTCAQSNVAGPAARPPATSRTGLLGLQSRHILRCRGRGTGGRRGADAQSRHKQGLLRHPAARSSPASASAALAGCTSAISGLGCGKPVPAKSGGRSVRQAVRLSARLLRGGRAGLRRPRRRELGAQALLLALGLCKVSRAARRRARPAGLRTGRRARALARKCVTCASVRTDTW